MVARFTKWLAEEFAGHAIVEAGSRLLGVGAEQAFQQAVNKLTRKDLLLGVIYARLGTETVPLTNEQIAAGIHKLNAFYALLPIGSPRDHFERLLYRDALDAIQEHYKNQNGRVEKKDAQGKVTEITFPGTAEDAKQLHQRYLALVGHSGPWEICLELDKLYQASPGTKALDFAKTTARNIGTLAGGIFDGLTGKRRV